MMGVVKAIFKLTLMLVISAVILITLIVGSYVAWWYLEDQKVFYEAKFDKEKWMAADTIFGCTRGKMYYDLDDNYLKKGLTKEQVFQLLGLPENWRVYHRFYEKKKCHEYSLGTCRWIPVPSILLICYKNNKVTDFFLSDVNDWGEIFHLDELD